MLIARIHKCRNGATHLRVGQSAFSEDLKHRLQRIGSPARWIPSENSWDCPLAPGAVVRLGEIAREVGEVVDWQDGLQAYADEHLQRSDYEHEVRMAMEKILQSKQQLDPYVTLMNKVDGSPCPPLWHQTSGYHWSIRVRGLLLAWEMGTGKTRAACDASGGWYRQGQIQPMQPQMIDGKPGVAGGVLVVSPKTMLKTWQEELARWQNAHGIIISGEAGKKSRLAGTPAHYHIVNFEGLKYVTHNHYQGLIIDECHRTANNSTQTQNVLTVAERAQKKLGLTGTPIANDLKSIFYPMLILDGGRALGPSRTAFLEKYFNSHRNMAGFVEYEAHDDAATEIARAISVSTYFVKKEECLDLPPKTHTPIYLPMTGEQARYYQQIKNEAVTYIQDATVTIEQAAARCMKLLQVCQGFALVDAADDDEKGVDGRHFTDAKTEALMEMLQDQLRGRKVIIWTMFKYETKRLVEALNKAGIKHLRIDGTVKSQKVRDAAKDAWNSDPTITVFVRQLSMSEGVTLLGCEELPCFTTIYLSLNYRMTDLLQSQDRNHRIGQTQPCSYIYLLTENGIDRSVYDRLLEKVENANKVIHTGKNWYKELLLGTAA
jgi:SWI/SNF-related matrix-associated actin-dependent regulator of chromatin subfamily A-like protein 1